MTANKTRNQEAVERLFRTVSDSSCIGKRFASIAAPVIMRTVSQICQNYNVKIVPALLTDEITHFVYPDGYMKDLNYDRSSLEDKNLMLRYKENYGKQDPGHKNLIDEYDGKRDMTLHYNTQDNRRNDPTHLHNSELDHVVSLNEIFLTYSNAALSNKEIKRIANQDDNFALTKRLINNPKSDTSLRNWLADNDRNMELGLPYVEISDEARERMLSIDGKARKSVTKSANREVFRSLTLANGVDRFRETYSAVLGVAAESTVNIFITNLLVEALKPVFFEILDSLNNWSGNVKEELKVRGKRIARYIRERAMNISTGMNLAKNVVSNLFHNFINNFIKGILDLFFGFIKNILHIVKSGVEAAHKIFKLHTDSRFFHMSDDEKGEETIRIAGGCVIEICSIGLTALLEKMKIGERGANNVSAFFSCIATVLFLFSVDKADLFGIQNARVQEDVKAAFQYRMDELSDYAASLQEDEEALRCFSVWQKHNHGRFLSAMADGNIGKAFDIITERERRMGVPAGKSMGESYNEVVSKGLNS